MNSRYQIGPGKLTFTQVVDVSKTGVATNEQIVLPMTPDEAVELANTILKQAEEAGDKTLVLNDPVGEPPEDLLFLRKRPMWAVPEEEREE